MMRFIFTVCALSLIGIASASASDLRVKGFGLGTDNPDCDIREHTGYETIMYRCMFGNFESDITYVTFASDKKNVVQIVRHQYIGWNYRTQFSNMEDLLNAAIDHYGPPTYISPSNSFMYYGDLATVNDYGRVQKKKDMQGSGLLIQERRCGVEVSSGRVLSVCPGNQSISDTQIIYDLVDLPKLEEAQNEGRARFDKTRIKQTF